MIKRESSFQTFFNSYLRRVQFPTAVFELKVSTTDSLPFSRVEEHQINGLLATKHRQLVYKLPDTGYGFKSFDCMSLRLVPAYVVIKYPVGIFGIDIDDFVHEKETSERRSLTSGRANAIASFRVAI